MTDKAVERECEQCGEPIVGDLYRPRKFCSMACYHQSKVGKPHPWLVVPSEVRQRAGHALRGRPQSPEHVRKRAESVAGTLAATQRECVKCGDAFVPTQAAQKYCSGRCWNAAQRPKRYKNTAESRHRMKVNRDEYAALVAAQGEQCSICGGDNGGKRLPVDHDHEAGRIRGLLCHRCNTTLGLMADDPDRLIKAAVYLRRSRLRSVV